MISTFVLSSSGCEITHQRNNSIADACLVTVVEGCGMEDGAILPNRYRVFLPLEADLKIMVKLNDVVQVPIGTKVN